MIPRSLAILNVGIFFFTSACSIAKTTISTQATAALNEAIAAIDNGSGNCIASDSSTEDTKIISALRTHSFVIDLYEAQNEDDVILHHFILKNINPPLLIDAEITMKNEQCVLYSFGKIVQ